MYSSAIAPHALFVLPYENNDDDCGSAAPLQDVAELSLPVFPLDDEDDDIGEGTTSALDALTAFCRTTRPATVIRSFAADAEQFFPLLSCTACRTAFPQ